METKKTKIWKPIVTCRDGRLSLGQNQSAQLNSNGHAKQSNFEILYTSDKRRLKEINTQTHSQSHLHAIQRFDEKIMLSWNTLIITKTVASVTIRDFIITFRYTLLLIQYYYELNWDKVAVDDINNISCVLELDAHAKWNDLNDASGHSINCFSSTNEWQQQHTKLRSTKHTKHKHAHRIHTHTNITHGGNGE